jgi:hypothetical protein
MRTRVLTVADAVGSSRWSTTYVDDTISRVHTAGWRRILNANNTYRASARSVATSSAGAVPFSSLSSGTADNVERFYRVLGVRVGNLVYGEVESRDWLLGSGAGEGPAQGYFFANQSLYTPAAVSTAITVWVNHLPVAFNAISADGVAVVWPTDYEDCLCYDAAAELLSMGAMETGPALELKALADAWWLDMLGDLGRLSVNPLQFKYSDNASDFGAIF